VLLVVVCLVAAIAYRYYDVRSYFESRENPSSGFAVTFPLDQLYYEYFMLAAFLVSLLGSYALLRDPERRYASK
jgi:hypothetical protein